MRGRLQPGWAVVLALSACVSLGGAQAVAQAAPSANQSAPKAAPQLWTWEQVKERLELNNPTLLAGKLNISELQADQITAHLRPNPNLGLLSDQIDPFNVGPGHGPFAYWLPSATLSYLIERRNKRGLRTESAKKETAIGISQQDDLERGLLFNLRSAFVQTLQAKAVLQVSQDNLDYYDHVLKISSDRYDAGDIAQIDLDRLQLQRVQYESDVQSAMVNLRTAKIQMLMLLNDRTPVDQFDLVGVFDSGGPVDALDTYRQIALDNRPDLKAATQTVDKAQTDYKLAVANGSTPMSYIRRFSTSESTFCAAASFETSRSSPLYLKSFASNGGGLDAPSSAWIVQYSTGTNARISSSRSTMRRSATVCTRPAESPRRTLSQRIGETL